MRSLDFNPTTLVNSFRAERATAGSRTTRRHSNLRNVNTSTIGIDNCSTNTKMLKHFVRIVRANEVLCFWIDLLIGDNLTRLVVDYFVSLWLVNVAEVKQRINELLVCFSNNTRFKIWNIFVGITDDVMVCLVAYNSASFASLDVRSTMRLVLSIVPRYKKSRNDSLSATLPKQTSE